MSTQERFYAVRQARTRVIGSRTMTRQEAEREVSAWREHKIPAFTCTAVIQTRSNFGSGSDLFYLYTDVTSAQAVGCLREMPAAGKTYRVSGIYSREPADVTVSADFRTVKL